MNEYDIPAETADRVNASTYDIIDILDQLPDGVLAANGRLKDEPMPGLQVN